MKEMDAFKKAVDGWRDTSANLIDHQKTMKTKALRVIAALFLDTGRDGFDWIKQGMIPLIQGGLQIDSLLRDEIAAVKAEREREALENKPVIAAGPKSTLPKVGQRLTKEEAEQLPVGSLVWCKENDGQVKCSDGLWHWEYQGRHYTCNILRHDGPYTLIMTTELPTPQPGDRLTAGQMKDAPDGTVVRHPHDTTMRFERLDGKWYMQGTNTLPVDVLGGNFWPIVRWGNPS